MTHSRTTGPVPEAWPPIEVDVIRGPVVESMHTVIGTVMDPQRGEARVWGDSGRVTTLRSAAKPFQALVLLLDGVDERFALTDEDIAITCGSHSGEPDHVAAVQGLMTRAGVESSMLLCGKQRPFHRETAEALGDQYTVIHHNCSGKHAGMLAWCRAQDADVATYRDADHPLQARTRQVIAQLAELTVDDVLVGVDGCGVPTFAMPIHDMAHLFHHLVHPEAWLATASAEALDPDEQARMAAALGRIADIMATHPRLIGGTGRFDTDVIAATKGRLVVKTGAEGLWCGADRASGVAFAFKTIDGEFRAVVPAAVEALASEGLVTAAELAALARHREPHVKDIHRRIVGRIVARLP